MRRCRLMVAVAVVMAVSVLVGPGGCRRESSRSDAGRPQATRFAPPVVAAGDTIRQDAQPITEGYEQTYPDAGFHVYWPSGCTRIVTREPDEWHLGDEQQASYTCERGGVQDRGCSIFAYRNAHASDGSAPDPTMVVARVENVLKSFGAEVVRQRPFSAGGIQGVEVQAEERSGDGQVWVRGVLAGPDIFILAAWNKHGGLFDDTEIRDFFASFRPQP